MALGLLGSLYCSVPRLCPFLDCKYTPIDNEVIRVSSIGVHLHIDFIIARSPGLLEECGAPRVPRVSGTVHAVAWRFIALLCRFALCLRCTKRHARQVARWQPARATQDLVTDLPGAKCASVGAHSACLARSAESLSTIRSAWSPMPGQASSDHIRCLSWSMRLCRCLVVDLLTRWTTRGQRTGSATLVGETVRTARLERCRFRSLGTCEPLRGHTRHGSAQMDQMPIVCDSWPL